MGLGVGFGLGEGVTVGDRGLEEGRLGAERRRRRGRLEGELDDGRAGGWRG